MSDTWYRTPEVIPPYEDGYGRLWALDGTQVGGPPEEPPPAWLARWPEDLQFEAFRAALVLDFFDGFVRRLREGQWPA